MENIILVVHVLTALAIVVFVLLQRGKGAEVGASFGAGASQTMFGSTGSWNFFSKVTAVLATVFFVTSFGLAILAKRNASVDGAVLPALESYRQEAGDSADIPSDKAESEFDIPALNEQNEQEGDVSDIPDFGEDR